MKKLSIYEIEKGSIVFIGGKKYELTKNVTVLNDGSIVANSTISDDTVEAYLLYWVEKERGMGRRPDGVSLHKNKQDAKKYKNAFYEKRSLYHPDEYTQPERGVIVEISKTLYDTIEGNGNRYISRNKIEYKEV